MHKMLTTFLIGLTLPASAIADTPMSVQNDVSTRIIGGKKASTADWKFIAALVNKETPASIGHFCGGSFLGGKYVLTAAHCVEDTNADDIDIILGLYDQNNESQAQRIAVRNIYSHTAYDSETTNNDIAIIELERSVDGTTIELANPTVLNSVRAGDKVHVAGWGNTSTTGKIFPTVLRQVDLEYVDRTICKNLGGDYSNVSDDGICAGYLLGGKDSCQGDSGGPLIFNDNGINKLLGVVSWGAGCAQPLAYGVYANVAHFQSNGWIDSYRNTISYTQYRNLHLVERKAQQETFTIRNDGKYTSLTVNSVNPSRGLTIAENSCITTLSPSQSCEITVDYTPGYSASTETIEVTTDHPKLPKLSTTLEYQGVDQASDALTNAIPIAGVQAYTNDNAWTASNSELISADIGFNIGESILHLTNLPKGKLEMDVKVLSDSFDVLFIYVNGKPYDDIDHLLNYSRISANLYRTSNTVTLVYKKNFYTSTGYEARAYIRNITMSDITDTNNDTNHDSSTYTVSHFSSGGSLSLGLVMLLAAASLLRRKKG
ncbi:trypsin-like serine protease [Vibrio parahaemolyticus]|uniref:trypsin-like serine protease n=1 Tax=Vibrio parahaemolyticus TaxID=670 RepID=UPI0038913D93